MSTLAIIAVIAVQVAGGSVVWRLVRRDTMPAVEAVGMGFAIGSVAATLASQITLATIGSGWGWVMVPICGLGAWAGARAGWWSLAGISWGRIPDVVCLVPALVLGGVALIPSLLLTPLYDGYVVGGAYQPDTVFQEALSQSVASWGPFDSSMLSGQPVRYHWLVYGWLGNLTEISGAQNFFVMTRVFPVVILLAAVILAAAWARALSPVWWVPGFAALLVAAGGYVGALQGVVLTYDSPSTSYAATLALALALAMSLWLRPRTSLRGGGLLSVIGFLAFALVGAKASQAFVVACGVIGVVVWGIATRRIGLVLPIALASGSGMILGFILFLLGVAGDDTNIGLSGTQQHASTFQGLDPFPGTLGIILGTLFLLLAIAPRWIGTVWLFEKRRMAPEGAFAIGLMVAAIGTLAVLRSGTNAAWFALASTALLSVLSAVGISSALARVGYSRNPRSLARDVLLWILVVSVGINVVVLITFALAAVSGASVLWRGPVIAWILAMAAALILVRSRGLSGTILVRWAVLTTVIITVTSIGARINGSLVWAVAHSRATPIVQDFIRVFDPQAQFPESAAPPSSRHGSGWRAAMQRVAEEDSRGAEDGVARRMSIIQWTPQMNAAALTLRDASDTSDLIAVSQPRLQPFLPLVSERRAWLAGLPYSIGYTTQPGLAAAESRERAVDLFLTAPSTHVSQELWKAGVRWVWVTPESFASLTRVEAWTDEVVTGPDVVVLRLNDPGAN